MADAAGGQTPGGDRSLKSRLFGDISTGYGGVMVSLGDKLGL